MDLFPISNHFWVPENLEYWSWVWMELVKQRFYIDYKLEKLSQPFQVWWWPDGLTLRINILSLSIIAIGFNVEQIKKKNLKFQVWDLGGQTSIRPYWRCYFSNTDAIIYVVDSTDRDRIGISKQELVSMLEVWFKLFAWPNAN